MGGMQVLMIAGNTSDVLNAQQAGNTLISVNYLGRIQAGTALVTGGGLAGGNNGVQLQLGYGPYASLYQQWVTTSHAAATGVGNNIKFWTGDGTANGVFPTNAVLGLTISNGKATVPASILASAGLNAPHGVAPTTLVDGDIWTTTAGMFVRVNGVTKTVTLT